MTDRKTQVRAKEYEVNAYPDPDHPDAAHFLIRVIRFDARGDDLGGREWGVFDCSGLNGRQTRLGPDGQWSNEPKDTAERQAWRDARRYTEAQALELARAAAPHMVTGPEENLLTIDAWLVWWPLRATLEKARGGGGCARWPDDGPALTEETRALAVELAARSGLVVFWRQRGEYPSAESSFAQRLWELVLSPASIPPGAGRQDASLTDQ